MISDPMRNLPSMTCKSSRAPFPSTRSMSQSSKMSKSHFRFYTNHWNVCELCRAFACAECVAASEDIGLGDNEPCDSVGEEAAWEIPF